MIDTNNKTTFFKNIQIFVTKNLRSIIIIFGVLILLLISYQTYNYILLQDLKKTSIKFFKSIDENKLLVNNLEEIQEDKNIYSILSTLKLIQNNNEKNNFVISNDLYKEVINSKYLKDPFKSSVAAHASFTLINASYKDDTTNYLKDISFYINNINQDLQDFFSIKKELEYLLIVTELDIKKIDYNNNTDVINIYNEISNSNIISSLVKERVKKIHEFQVYK